MKTSHFIGRDDEGTRYFVEINLDVEHNAQRVGSEVEFTDHSTGTLEHVLSVTGFAIEEYRREASMAGQMHGEFVNVTKPAIGWTLEDIASLVDIAKEWHLNDTNAWSDEQRSAAGEAHERAEYPQSGYDLMSTSPSNPDSTGYKYGSKWLARQLPADVVTEIERLQSLPYGDIPENY